MSIGVFRDQAACMLGLTKAYPDEATRKRVCVGLEARMTRPRLEGASDVVVQREEAEQVTLKPTVERHEGFMLIRNLVATREGVSVGHKVLKRRSNVAATAELLNGAPIVYGEAHYGDFEPDTRTTPGFAVNARLEGDAAVYDALLWTANPSGYSVPLEDLERNEAFAAAVTAGHAVHNSVGSIGVERMENGVASPMGGGAPVPYQSEQVRVNQVGHIAILHPIAGGKGSCPAPACGAPPTGVDAVAAKLGVRRAAVLQAAARAARADK